MKRLFQFLMVSALAVSMLGCSGGPSVEPEIPDTPNNPTQLAVQLRLKGEIATPATRVGAEGFENSDKVGVYVSSTGSLASTGNMLDNESFTYSSTDKSLAAPSGKEVYWGTNDTRLSVWAYYPYAESVSNNAAYAFAVATDQSTTAEFYNSDFITAQATNLAPQSTPVNLTFNHSLSKIDVIFTSEDELADDKVFKIGGLATDGTIDLATGTATAGTTKAMITPLAGSGDTYSAIVYPQQEAVTFRLEMDGDVYQYTTDVELAAGYQYEFTLSIDVREPQQMSLAATAITPWKDGDDHTGAMSDIINIPDPVFKAYLLSANIYEYQENSTIEDASDDYIDTGVKIDADGDGEISIADAEKVVYIDVNGLGVGNLSGIEYFTNLEYLDCSQKISVGLNEDKTEPIYTYPSSYLTSIDLSSNNKLKYLICRNNYNLDEDSGLSSLVVSGNENLEYLDFTGNRYVEQIDLSKNTKLKVLYCGSNIKSLDVSKFLDLQYLFCGGNMNIAALDVSKNVKLKSLLCTGTKISTLDVTKNVDLEVLQCDDCNLTSLDVSKNTKLYNLWCGDQDITSLDVSMNTALTTLVCWNTKLTTLDLSTNILLEELGCSSSELTSLDISNLSKLEYLDCAFNKFDTLDVSNNLLLSYLNCPAMLDDDGNAIALSTLYMATGQTISKCYLDTRTAIEYK